MHDFRELTENLIILKFKFKITLRWCRCLKIQVKDLQLVNVGDKGLRVRKAGMVPRLKRKASWNLKRKLSSKEKHLRNKRTLRIQWHWTICRTKSVKLRLLMGIKRIYSRISSSNNNLYQSNPIKEPLYLVLSCRKLLQPLKLLTTLIINQHFSALMTISSNLNVHQWLSLCSN